MLRKISGALLLSSMLMVTGCFGSKKKNETENKAKTEESKEEDAKAESRKDAKVVSKKEEVEAKKNVEAVKAFIAKEVVSKKEEEIEAKENVEAVKAFIAKEKDAKAKNVKVTVKQNREVVLKQTLKKLILAAKKLSTSRDLEISGDKEMMYFSGILSIRTITNLNVAGYFANKKVSLHGNLANFVAVSDLIKEVPNSRLMVSQDREFTIAVPRSKSLTNALRALEL